jgi:hypothetical protein
METMLARRARVQELIVAFRDSGREPFPKWGLKVAMGPGKMFEAGQDASKFVM